MKLNSTIEQTIANLNVNQISDERQKTLQSLIDFIQNKVNETLPVRINFICTHNSRRSHLSQIWAQVAATHYEIDKVVTYSGGTEATAMFPKIGETLTKQGFELQQLSEGNNPVYAISYSDNEQPIIAFSKKLSHDFNPKSEFAAVMTCNSANEACPVVSGAEKRIPITYEDPKKFDNTLLQDEKYLERSVQIATELLYVFSKVKK